LLVFVRDVEQILNQEERLLLVLRLEGWLLLELDVERVLNVVDATNWYNPIAKKEQKGD
jgi:hypothetical protein